MNKIFYRIYTYFLLLTLSIKEKRKLPNLRFGNSGWCEYIPFTKTIYIPLMNDRSSLFHEWKHYTQHCDGKLPLTKEELPDYEKDLNNIRELIDKDPLLGLYNEQFHKDFISFLKKYPFEFEAYSYQINKINKYFINYGATIVLQFVILKSYGKE